MIFVICLEHARAGVIVSFPSPHAGHHVGDLARRHGLGEARHNVSRLYILELLRK